MYINDKQLIEEVIHEISKYLDAAETDETEVDFHEMENIRRWRDKLSKRVVSKFKLPNDTE